MSMKGRQHRISGMNQRLRRIREEPLFRQRREPGASDPGPSVEEGLEDFDEEESNHDVA